jgi:hypothetical protein
MSGRDARGRAVGVLPRDQQEIRKIETGAQNARRRQLGFDLLRHVGLLLP